MDPLFLEVAHALKGTSFRDGSARHLSRTVLKSQEPRAKSWKLFVRLPGLCRCQWQLGRLAQHVALLVGEHAFVTLRFQHAFALVWRHGSQITDGRFHHLPARRW